MIPGLWNTHVGKAQQQAASQRQEQTHATETASRRADRQTDGTQSTAQQAETHRRTDSKAGRTDTQTGRTDRDAHTDGQQADSRWTAEGRTYRRTADRYLEQTLVLVLVP